MAGERVETCDQLEFDVVEVADTMGWQLPLVKRGLRQLQWSTGGGAGPNNGPERCTLPLKTGLTATFLCQAAGGAASSWNSLRCPSTSVPTAT